MMRVSIIILSYNYESFVAETIRSALAQTYPNKEVIVVDDGSTDGSREVIARFGDRITTVFKPNGGQPSSYNAGFEQATGDIVIFLDCDDTLDPNACDEIVRTFVDSRVVKAHYRMRLIDADGNPLGGTIPRQLGEGDLGLALRERGELYPSSPGSANAYRKRALDRLFPLPLVATDPQGADFFTAYGICLLGEVRVAGTGPLGGYRMHRTSVITQVTFGNAVQLSEPFASYARYDRLRSWIAERLGGSCVLPERVLPSFSLEKQAFALTVFGQGSYLSTLRRGARYLTDRMMPAIRARPGSSAARLALAGWALSVLVLPRRLGLPLARYVCNPASR
jgi:glycosyltransferase involved in cell wall biosynthesis